MAKKVIWSKRAQNDRKNILKYWSNRNRSSTYSILLNQKFKEAISIIQIHPRLGKPTNNINIRIKIVRDYLIIYRDSEILISILTILDSRQNPQNFEEILKS